MHGTIFVSFSCTYGGNLILLYLEIQAFFGTDLLDRLFSENEQLIIAERNDNLRLTSSAVQSLYE